jgi:phage gpG-like protein
MRDLARRAIRVEGAAKRNATGNHAPGANAGAGGSGIRTTRAGASTEGLSGPNVITGRLRNSITWRLGEDEHGPYAEVGSAVEYAAYVELGTSRAPAYPFLRPALEAARTNH